MQLQISTNGTVISRLMPFFFLVSPAILSLLAGTITYAQDKTSEVDKIFSWATSGTPGCVCAVSQNGKVIVNRAYGSADLERNVPLHPGSIFDAGSLQKQFVAAAALLLVEEGKLSLTEDIHQYLPELPDYGHRITINHLLTHTSGIRDWTGILPIAAGNPDALTVIMRQRSLNIVPGEEWSYSNSGFVLMKEIVARRSGMSFGEFTAKRLFEPLGMKSTSYREDMRAVIRDRALAYDRDNSRWKMAMLLDNDRGGGGLLSTASDLLIWNDALTNGRISKFVSEKIEEPSKLNNGRKLVYARGLFLDTYRGTKEVWHTGSAEGYKSWLGRYPEFGLSIAIMCNSGDGTDRTSFAHRIFDLFAPAGTPKAESKAPPVVTGGGDPDLKSRMGLYFNEQTGEPLRLAVDSGRLRVAGGPGLVPIGKDRFKRFGAFVHFMSQDEFELQFLSQEQFELKSMEGKTTRYRRAQPYTPTADDLKAFAGRYESDEIGSIFQVVAGENGLVVRLEHAPKTSVPLRPVERDTFQAGMMMMRFVRDQSGKVVAINYSNPVLRKVKFTRLSEVSSHR